MAIIHDRIAAARAGTNPTVICKMPSGWAVMADSQFLPGYAILIADPIVPDLNALDAAGRTRYLLDMTILGDALLEVTSAYRINYETLGNFDPVLHTHVLPRYTDEPEDLRKGPAWFYSPETRAARPFDPQRDGELMKKIAASIQKRLEELK
jgi:diadenosine tetraphosphate (Ap4A) HIT family hydrolase